MGKYGKIVVLAGGPSSEREISLRSGRAVAGALKRRGEEAELFELKDDIYDEVKSVTAGIAFIALHGKFGEDGTVQGILEDMKVPYTGSGIHASRLALDKIASKELFFRNGLNVPDYRIVEKEAKISLEEFTPFFVVKPPLEGSSIGLTVVRERKETKAALKKAWQYSDAALVEEYIEGRELTVGILDGKAFPIIEIFTKNKVYDFEAKYVDAGTTYEVPANLKKEESEKVEVAALAAYKILGCRHFARVDLKLNKKGVIYVLEVNTIPGMTERSLLPKAARASGINFDDLCLNIIGLAYGRKE
ncbi:MAG: D-alanine--D-alanine ligase [Candidatus Omnitrophica bacterium]|nr:D-alanine--D-alanine ligase [Candidatus Omnitrophota bacterium]